ncbi:hypothetical protein M0638_18795 [Roseomonas sp. NAR14]|uniref:Uncharacterized protein n=1 Tax=Roseomonas acroporae TaxID=2937791 RepID=A0A9X1YC23_9PROT|nr:hypothetical protein [Roseomonas acroporae]MCK8786428.1 hypothetical protein [Roseomonas acroporae]
MWNNPDRALLPALLVSTAWLLLCQLVFVVLWHFGWMSHGVALLHWLVVGVMPPGMALWRFERERGAG